MTIFRRSACIKVLVCLSGVYWKPQGSCGVVTFALPGRGTSLFASEKQSCGFVSNVIISTICLQDDALFCIHLSRRIWFVHSPISAFYMLPSLVSAQYILPSKAFPANLDHDEKQLVRKEDLKNHSLRDRSFSHRIDEVLFLDAIVYAELDDLLGCMICPVVKGA